MRIAIIGSGAMGLFVGAKLAHAGNDVTMIDVVPEIIEKLNKDGILLELPDGELRTPVKACYAGSMTQYVELAILFTKTIYSASALAACGSYVGPETYVMTMQNGLGNIELINESISKERIIAAVTTYSGTLKGPGHTASANAGYLKIMTANNMVTDKLREINQALKDAALNSEIAADVMVAIWEKAAFNTAVNGITALCRIPNMGLAATPETVALMYALAEETCRVANAHGIPASFLSVKQNLDNTPVIHAEHITSMLQDVFAKRKTEAAFIPGAIASKAREAGLDAPYNEALFALIHTVETTYAIQK